MSFYADRFGTSFAKVTPPRSFTFSERSVPCRYEIPLGDPNGANADGKIAENCPFRESGFCDRVETDGILNRKLTEAYSEHIKCVLSEASTSVVIRSEQQFHQRDLCRFAQRRHFYEIVAFAERPERFGANCTRLAKGDRLGEYVGFVDLRLHYHKSPLAFGLLVEPSWIREEPLTFMIKGDYGPLFGAHSFRSSVYAMQDPKTIGAMCAQMSAIMAIGMLADRGADVKGSFTITFLAWRHCGKTGDSANELRGDTGLSPEELTSILGKCRVRAMLHNIPVTKPETLSNSIRARRLAIKFIESFIYARFPVILAVDSETWCSKKMGEQEGHAVTIVGVRRYAATGGLAGFIVHDPGGGPFKSILCDRLITAASAYSGLGRLSFVAVAENTLSQMPSDCTNWLLRFEAKRLTGPTTFEEVYSSQEDRYEIRLLNQRTILRHLSLLNSEGSFAEDERTAIQNFLDRLPESRFWMITGMKSILNTGGLSVDVVWLFDANKEKRMPPVLAFGRDSDGQFVAFKP